MNIQSRKPLIAMIALSAALATPLAFAQVDTTPTGQTNPPSTMQSQQEQQEQIEAAQQVAEDAVQPRPDATEGGLLENIPDAMTQDAHTDDHAGTGAEVATDASATGTATAETAATGAAMQSTQQATGSGRQQGWEELDIDGDGAISTQEAAANPGLTLIFADADADADGVLTVAEYRTFVTTNYSQPQPE